METDIKEQMLIDAQRAKNSFFGQGIFVQGT